MFPAYGYMDSYPKTSPHQRDHIPYPYHYYPSWEAIPPHMRVDSSKPPSAFGPWPYHGGISYSIPTECNGCCSHSYSPDYYSFRPPHSHIQTPPQLFFHGLYPPYPAAQPAYFIPPPHYSADQAQYDYDKAKNHCCGCPNHTFSRKDDSLKIEEQRPETEQDSDSGMVRLPNYPYPVVWVPPSHMKDKETSKISESHPKIWNGWVPLDINSLKALRQREDENKNLQSEDKSQLPLPVIWMPAYDGKKEPEKESKEIDACPKAAQEPPSKFKIIPVKLLENGNQGEKKGVVECESGNQVHPEEVVEKEGKTKTIPVKQMEECRNKKLDMPEKQEQKGEDKKSSIHEKQKVGSRENKSSENKQQSPVKSSKLPPVCLRVDPLPRRKTANGSSRSPSSPGHKEEKFHQDTKQQVPASAEAKEGKKEIKIVEVKDQLISEAKKEDLKSKDGVPVVAVKNIPGKEVIEESLLGEEGHKEAKEGKRIKVVEIKDQLTEQVEKEDSKSKGGMSVASVKDTTRKTVAGEAGIGEGRHKAEEYVGGVEASDGKKAEEREAPGQGSGNPEYEIETKIGAVESSESKKNEGRKERSLSQTDAAVLIQSAYRGFEVRRWQPVEKLRQIARIREQVGDVKRQLDGLEASLEQKQDEKQRVIIGETIMNLLLQLDTIQGLHPSVREIRKSVAKMLICLQEKLDSLESQATPEHKPEKAEDMAADRTSDVHLQAACDISLSALNQPTSEQDSVQPANEKDAAEQPSVKEKEEPDTEQQKNLAIPLVEGKAPESAEEVVELNLPSLKDEMASHGNEEFKEEFLLEGVPNSGVEVLVKSQLASEGLYSRPEEPGKSSLVLDGRGDSMMGQVLELPPDNGVSGLGVKRVTELQKEVASQDLESMKEELPDSKFALPQEEKANPESEKPSVLPFEEGSNLEEAAAFKFDEPDSAYNTEISGEKDELDSGIRPSLLLDEEAYTKQGELQKLGVTEEGDRVDTELGSLPVISVECEEEKTSFAAGKTSEATIQDETDSLAMKEKGSDLTHLEDSALVTKYVPSADLNNKEKKLLEENSKLREMLERLLEAGKEQLGVISDLNGRVKDLEKKLAQKKRVKITRHKAPRSSPCNLNAK